MGGIVLLALGVFLTLGLISRLAGDGGLMGPFGRAAADSAVWLFGAPALLVAAALVVAPIRMLIGKPWVKSWTEGLGGVLLVVSAGLLLQLAAPGWLDDVRGPGGVIGGGAARALVGLVSIVGAALVGVAALVIALLAATPLDREHLVKAGTWLASNGWSALRVAGAESAAFLGEVVRAILPDSSGVPEEDLDEPKDSRKKTRKIKALIDEAPAAELESTDTVRVGEPVFEPIILEPKKKGRGKAAAEEKIEAPAVMPAGTGAAAAIPATPDPNTIATLNGKAEPQIVESKFTGAKKDLTKKKDGKGFISLSKGEYQLPSIDLLHYEETSVKLDKDAMKEVAARLVAALGTFGIKGEVHAIRPGPVVTMYEFVPAPGTRVAKIASLTDDLALALQATSVRIIAPIPGKGAVGIELPNKQRETVYFKEILADDCFEKSRSKLTVALGKDSEGRPVAVDLAKMPHLLIAGTTGSGKSVGLNAMIASILFKASPEEVRMIMVDPKMLELAAYEGIPHLLLPVVTDPKKANMALRWAVEEMDRRYQVMADQSVKDIVSFNRKVETELAKPPAPAEAAPDEELAEGSGPHDLDGVQVNEDEHGQLSLKKVQPAEPLKKMPYIVVIIDEFADLMMQASKEVESSVARLAQKARACGIHLIVATQRPSVDVITGLIKSNFPSRIAFKVTNKTNSITILEQAGGEQLLGHGDSLFIDRGQQMIRVHGCYVQEEELHKIIEVIKKQAKPVYDMDILKPRDEDEGGGGGGGASAEGGEGGDSDDGIYDKAVQLVTESQQASTSLVQRRLRLGYSRAARMIERMEKEGIVSPPDRMGRREVVVGAIRP